MKVERHKWFKLRVHVYICGKCGTGKVNEERQPGYWVATYHRPDGTSSVLSHVPPCEEGPLTVKFIGKYAEQIARAVN